MTLQPLLNCGALLMRGVASTLGLWATSLVIALPVGIATGIVRCARLRSFGIASTLDLMTIVIRGVPLYVQLLIVYFVLPALLHINLSSFSAGVLALGLCSSAYVSEIIRSGMNSIDTGQWEAATVLGFSVAQTVRFIIVPQMFKNSLPALINELVAVMKSTSILATIGVVELTKIGQNIVARSMDPLSVYGSIAIVYLGLNGAISVVGKWVEQQLKN